MAKCCFDKVSIQSTYEPKWPYGTDLYARLFYIENTTVQVLIVALDTLATTPCEAMRFTKGVSAKTGIPCANIWYHELQVHAAPDSTVLHTDTMDKLIELISEKTLCMMNNAVAFECSVAEADTGDRFTMNREQYIHGLGGVTVWSGMSFDDKQRPYSTDPSIMLLRGYHPDLPAFNSPIYFDNPVDSKAYLFVFKDDKGKVIGTLSRFAAHPDVAVLFELKDTPHENEYHYCFDWPGYLCENLEAFFDAPSIYLNGPCADLSTKKAWDGMDTFEASKAECMRIGNEIADFLVSNYQKRSKPITNSNCISAAMFSFDLPTNNNFPKSRKELNELIARIPLLDHEINSAIAQNRPPYMIKTLIDERWRAWQAKVTVDEYRIFTDDTLGNETLTVTVSVIRFGDYLFIGVPGECLVDMSLWLRSTFSGVKTIPIDQVNGYFNYMATAASLQHGGYTYWSSWVSRESIPVLKQGIVKELQPWLDKQDY